MSEDGCPECGMTGEFISSIEAEGEKKIAKLKKECARLRSILAAVQLADKTTVYEYGEINRVGHKPGTGQRWKTPYELAKDALTETPELVKGGPK